MSTRTDRNRGQAWAVALLVVIGLILAVSVAFWLFPSLNIFFEQRQAGEEVVRDTYDAEKAINDYEWFREQWNDIEAKRSQINTTEQEMKSMRETYEGPPGEWPRDTRIQYERLRQQKIGQQNIHDEMVAEYNARSEQAHRSIWKCGLPYEMDEKFWAGDAVPNDKYREGAQGMHPPEDPAKCDALPSTADSTNEQ